jgi:hypothetical protein
MTSSSYLKKDLQGKTKPNAKELFNSRHSSLRVTLEKAFGALKNRFRILYNKSFHHARPKSSLFLHVVSSTTGYSCMDMTP